VVMDYMEGETMKRPVAREITKSHRLCSELGWRRHATARLQSSRADDEYDLSRFHLGDGLGRSIMFME
jgi:hypothetical protein